MIYFIEDSRKFIKIGKADDPDARLKHLQTANPSKLKIKALLEGSYQTEASLHYMFSHIKKNGEWFRYTDELKLFIAAIHNNPNIKNILELQKISLQYTIKKKAKRLKKKGNNKLSSRIKLLGMANKPG